MVKKGEAKEIQTSIVLDKIVAADVEGRVIREMPVLANDVMFEKTEDGKWVLALKRTLTHGVTEAKAWTIMPTFTVSKSGKEDHTFTGKIVVAKDAHQMIDIDDSVEVSDPLTFEHSNGGEFSDPVTITLSGNDIAYIKDVTIKSASASQMRNDDLSALQLTKKGEGQYELRIKKSVGGNIAIDNKPMYLTLEVSGYGMMPKEVPATVNINKTQKELDVKIGDTKAFAATLANGSSDVDATPDVPFTGEDVDIVSVTIKNVNPVVDSRNGAVLNQSDFDYDHNSRKIKVKGSAYDKITDTAKVSIVLEASQGSAKKELEAVTLTITATKN